LPRRSSHYRTPSHRTVWTVNVQGWPRAWHSSRWGSGASAEVTAGQRGGGGASLATAEGQRFTHRRRLVAAHLFVRDEPLRRGPHTGEATVTLVCRGQRLPSDMAIGLYNTDGVHIKNAHPDAALRVRPEAATTGSVKGSNNGKRSSSSHSSFSTRTGARPWLAHGSQIMCDPRGQARIFGKG